MQLTKTQKEAVRTLLRHLGLNQGAFSKRANWSPSAFSEVLKREDGKGVSPEKWVEIRQTLKELVDENSKRLAAEGQAELAKMLLDQLQGGGEEDGVQRLQFPGGALKARALNYVQRTCDVGLMSNLYRVEAPSIIVRGGIQYGKSSLLERFSERATKELGHRVVRSDAKTFEFSSLPLGQAEEEQRRHEGWPSSQLFGRIFKDFGIDATFTSRGAAHRSATEIALPAIEAWLEKTLQDHDRVFLLIDSLDSLVGRVEEQAFTEFLSFAAGLRTRSSQRLFDRLTLIVAYSGTGWSASYASKFQSQGYELDVQSFRLDNVVQLLRLLEIKDGEDAIAKQLCDFFLGHPHLIHLAAYEISLHGVKVALQMAHDLVGAFQTHVDRLCQEVARLHEVGRFAASQEASAVPLLRDLFLHIERQEPVSKLLQENLSALVVMGLVVMSPAGVQVSEFYRIAIQRELKKFGATA